MPPASHTSDRTIETDIPARLDALLWSTFHTRVVVALGITWILDGLEVTLAGALAGAVKESPTLHFSNFDVGLANSAYLLGAVLGALGFGWLTDRIGRKKLFFITLAVYLTATAATALSWNVASYALFRSSRARALAANIPRSIQQIRNWCLRVTAAGPIWSSTAVSGLAQRWALVLR